MKRFATFFFVTLAIVVGCSSSDDDDETVKVGNGVNNLRVACDTRKSSWNRGIETCTLCEAGVVNTHCECESLKAFSGACLDQENARKAACSEETKNCVFRCTFDECDCLDACYATAPAACKEATDARDGCILAACTNFCK